MRKPHQILAFPYKKDNDGSYLYGILCRVGKKERWQGIAGGVEDNETYLEACHREANEEVGISYSAKIIKLDSISTIPVINVTKKFIWGNETILIYEHCFGIDAIDENIKLSHEHSKIEWLKYEDAFNKLTWDSNKNALWELNHKLTNSNITKNKILMLKTNKFKLEKVNQENKSILWNLLQFALYDGSFHVKNEINNKGIFEYTWFDNYFLDKDREAYFVKVNNKLIGFAMVNENTKLEHNNVAKTIAEFLILPQYRKNGIGKHVAFVIFNKYNCSFEVQPMENNKGAYLFWEKVIDEYTNGNYKINKIDDQEDIFTFNQVGK